MKFRHVTVLDDPWTSVERAVVLPGDQIFTRLADSEIVYAMLAALRDSDSLSEFYEKNIGDSQQQVRRIDGCVARANDSLTREEERFQDFVFEIVAGIRQGQVSLATAAERHQATLHIIDAWWKQLDSRVEQTQPVRERLEEKTYVYSSYLIHLAKQYVEKGSSSGDGNDFEDAKFCQHLALGAEMTAVTDDKALRGCLESTLADLRELSSVSDQVRLLVRDSAEFKSSVCKV